MMSVLVVPNGIAQSEDQHIKVRLRTIADEFLLQMDDSTTRILPVEKVDGRYAVRFETEFSFEPDLLLFSAFKVLEEYEISVNYIVEVEACGSNSIMHSFTTDKQSEDNMGPCQQRFLPRDCYVLYFTTIESEEVINQEKRRSDAGFNYWYLILALTIILGVVLYFKSKTRKVNKKSNMLNIGKYHFDQKGMMLKLKAQSIELSSKESDLLFLLFSNENKTLEREYILNVVWGDEGDYVGRTLDVFISKLRKKLQADENIKIVNIRGVGYKLIINTP